MTRPRLKRTAEVLAAPDGDVYVLWSGGDEDVRIVQPSEAERGLLATLDGSLPIAELRARFGAAAVDDALAQLRGLGLIEDADDDALVPDRVRARFDRQLRYFSDVGSAELPPSACQRRLEQASVAILGVGGLGGRVAWELACCGVGELRLIDGDEVELSNLNRQTLYAERDVGAPKVAVAAQRLRAFNSGVRIVTARRRLEGEADVAAFVAGADLVVNAADWPAHEIEAWCNSACFAAGIPHIGMSQLPPRVRIGPLYVPGRTGCHECQRIGHRRDHPLFDVAVERQRRQPSPAATLGPASGLIGAQVGMDVVHFLTGLVEPASLGAACMYDLRTMEVERLPVAPEPECPTCSRLWRPAAAPGSARSRSGTGPAPGQPARPTP